MSPDEAVARLRRLPFADVGDARSTTTARCARACPRRSTGPARRPSSARPSSASCSPTAPARCCSPGRPTTSETCLSRTPTVPQSRRAASWSGGLPEVARPERVVVVTAGTADSPVADECGAHTPRLRVRPDRRHRRRRRRPAPAARPRSTTLTAADAVVVVAGMEGALASVRRRPDRRPGRRRADQRRLRRRRSTASPRCWRCTRRARAASRWSASTTASAPRAPSPARLHSGRPDDDRTSHRLVQLLRRRRRRHDAGRARRRRRRPRRWSRRCSAGSTSTATRSTFERSPALRRAGHVGQRRRPRPSRPIRDHVADHRTAARRHPRPARRGRPPGPGPRAGARGVRRARRGRGRDPRRRSDRRRVPRGRRARRDRRRRRRVRSARDARRRRGALQSDRRRPRLGPQLPTATSPTRHRPPLALLAEAGVPTVGLDTTLEAVDAHRRGAHGRARRRLRRHALDLGPLASATAPAPPTRPAGPTWCRW